jgi:hypothetical protein
VKVEAGSLRGRLPESLDLCSSCADSLASFLQGGKPRQANQAATPGAIPDPGDRSTAQPVEHV